MSFFEPILYTIVISVVVAANSVAYVLSKRYQNLITVSYYRFFLLLSIWLLLDMLYVYIEPSLIQSKWLQVVQKPLFFIVNCIHCMMLYQTPVFIMHLTAVKPAEHLNSLFKRMAVFFLTVIVLRLPLMLLGGWPTWIEDLLFLALNTSWLCVIIWVLWRCISYIRSAKESMRKDIAKAIVWLVSVFFIGFFLDLVREGFISDILQLNHIRLFLEQHISIRFYTLFYFFWSLIFLKKTLAVLAQNASTLNEQLCEEAYKNYGITQREKEVIALVSKGKSNQEIAAELFISDKTVKRHIQNIYEKIGVKNRLELLKKMSQKA